MKIRYNEGMVSVKAKGDFFGVGSQVGEVTRELIRFMIDQVSTNLLTNVFGGDKEAMLATAKVQHERAFNYFFESCQYLEGLAFGADVATDDLLPASYCEEISAHQYVAGQRERCSTVVTRGLDGWLVGHQEDFWEVFFGKMIVLELEFKGYPKLVSLSYPGQLPALAGSLNARGVAITNNALWPKAGSGIPKQARHFRAALTSTFLDALSTLARGPHALTDHFTVIGAEEDLAASIEVSNPVASPDECAMRLIVHDDLVLPGESVGTPFAHTNHVQLLDLHEADPAHPGSYLRLGKLYVETARHSPRAMGDMLDLLTRPDGILRKTPGYDLIGQKNSFTLATIVISPSEGKITFVRYGGRELAQEEFIL